MTPPAVALKLRDKRITDSMRLELKRPWGKIINNEELIKGLEKGKLLISVGDITTLMLLENSIIPDVSFIDFKFKRRDISEAEKGKLMAFEAKTVKLKNPPGIISVGLMKACKKVFEGKIRRTKVIVDGEEDLAALASAIYAPLDSIIIYGQPDEGAVFMHLTEKYKNLAEKYYSEAETA